MNNYNKKEIILLNTILGDALSNPIDGLSRAHIKSIFKQIHDYIDPTPALKGKIEKWKKPALYSSISQILIILAMLDSQNKLKISFFNEIIRNSPVIDAIDNTIFRNPGKVEALYLHNIKKNNAPPSITSAKIIPSLIPFSFQKQSGLKFIINLIKFIINFNIDYSAIGGAISFLALIQYLFNNNISSAEDLILTSINLNSLIIENINCNSGQIFDLKINPDSIINSLKNYNTIFKKISHISEKEKGEEIIYKYVNNLTNSSYKRATVDNPLLLIPYTLFLNQIYKESHQNLLFKVASEGGSIAIITSLSGAILGCINPTNNVFPEILIKNLVNRKKILAILDKINKKKITEQVISDYLNAEFSLTKKEQEELNAKLKHSKSKPIRKTSQKRKENELSQHIVESWTKLDKAKWKKKKKKIQNEQNSK